MLYPTVTICYVQFHSERLLKECWVRAIEEQMIPVFIFLFTQDRLDQPAFQILSLSIVLRLLFAALNRQLTLDTYLGCHTIVWQSTAREGAETMLQVDEKVKISNETL